MIKILYFEDIFCQKQVQHVESLRSLASHARYLFLLTLFSAGLLLTHKQLHWHWDKRGNMFDVKKGETHKKYFTQVVCEENMEGPPDPRTFRK